MPVEWGWRSGQTHFNSDARIADEGRPQGVPLPFGPGEGTHKGCPYRLARGRAPTRGAPTVWFWGGRPQGVPLPFGSWEGRPQGVPLPFGPGKGPQGVPLPFGLGRAPTRGARFGPGRAPTRGAPTVWPWGGHPQGVPLPMSCPFWPGGGQGCPYRLALGRAHKGCPYRLVLGRAPTRGAPTVLARGRAPTRGAPTVLALGRAPTRGAPTVWFWEGHPQGVPLPDSDSLTWVCPNLMQMPWGGGSPAYAGIDLCGVPVACLNWGGWAENSQERRIRAFRSGLGLVASEGCQALGAEWARRLAEHASAPASTGIST